MTESFNVIALISGGKDSFFSLLHCIQNGHKVVALGNLYPAPVTRGEGVQIGVSHEAGTEEDEHDLNSFMYQTVGHTVVPLYEQALGIPLYRQAIIGTAVQTGTSYSHSDAASIGSMTLSQPQNENEDETESLVPLLRKIMVEHPAANAISTGAILSTYQRTRIESVALRLGLTPLSYLWKYPTLPPGTQMSLLQDMQDVGLDARIVKVASGGLDESFLWENVASQSVMRRIEKSMKRFGTDGDGAVLGEGGEFETLVVDGPLSLFKGRIEVRGEDRRIVREGGGSAWLTILNAAVVMKDSDNLVRKECQIPDLLESRFSGVLNSLNSNELVASRLDENSKLVSSTSRLGQQLQQGPSFGVNPDSIVHWTFSAEGMSSRHTVSEEASKLIEEIQQRLSHALSDPSHIISTVIVLRSMDDFAAVNKVYGAIFTRPNPPARVTISCGSSMPKNIDIIIHLKLHKPSPSSPPRKALHVQSRSYWAPANIGPYSQAISIPLRVPDDQDSQPWTVSVAGQIPLIPHTMTLPSMEKTNGLSSAEDLPLSNFKFQTVLALQHLWRIGREMDVQWWTSAVAYLPKGSLENVAGRAAVAGKAWMEMHRRTIDDENSEDEDSRDLWEEKHYAGMENRGAVRVEKALPDWDMVEVGDADGFGVPPFFTAEVEELPRQSQIEWHAHLGVVDGPIKLFQRHSNEGWAIYQCTFGDAMQLVVMIDYSEAVSDFSKRLDGALIIVGAESYVDKLGFASYLDVSIEGIWDSGSYKGAIPCRTIWDGFGKRLAGVLLFSTV